MKKFNLNVAVWLAATTFGTLSLHAQEFLQTDVVEFVVSPCGTYAYSEVPPPGFHPNTSIGGIFGFGIVADPDKDGWETGSPTAYCGDYVYPGSPVEGFSVQVGDQFKVNGSSFPNCDNAGIPAESLQSMAFGDYRLALWTGAAGGVSVRQATIARNGEAYMVQRVKICNQGSETLDSVFYQRYLDPDPDINWGGSFATNNKVLEDLSAGSGVEARGIVFDNCRITLLSPDDRAQGSYGGFNASKPSQGYYGLGEFVNSGSSTADIGVQLTFKLNDLEPGQCDCAAYAYAFSPSDYPRAYRVARFACGAFDLFEEDEDPDLLASRLFGSNALESDATVFPWLAQPDGFILQDLQEGAYMEVFDLHGRRVAALAATHSAERFSDLPSGMYIVHIRNADGSQRSGKVLVP